MNTVASRGDFSVCTYLILFYKLFSHVVSCGMLNLNELYFVISGDNGRIVYSITSGNEKGDFEIASNGTIRTKRTLDREAQGLYNLVIIATDQAAMPEQRLSSTVQVYLRSN